MRAAIISEGRIAVEHRPDPVPQGAELLMRVRAAGINGADLHQRAGRYPAPPGAPPDIPGLECAGEVVALGPQATQFAEGDRVMALLGGGGHAELAVVHERHAVAIPDGIGWPEAGGFVEAFATAHDALFTQAQLQLGERLLVHGAAGGVGVAAVQLAREAGARTTGSVRRDDHRDRLRDLGIETEGEPPYDVILELVGGDNLAANLDLLATEGRISVIGVGAGARAEIDFMRLMHRRARIHGSMLRARHLEEKALVMQRLERHVVPLLAAGRITVPVHATYPLEKAQDAYDVFAAGGKFGKLVLVVG